MNKDWVGGKVERMSVNQYCSNVTNKYINNNIIILLLFSNTVFDDSNFIVISMSNFLNSSSKLSDMENGTGFLINILFNEAINHNKRPLNV
jgi:hypothetical protein